LGKEKRNSVEAGAWGKAKRQEKNSKKTKKQSVAYEEVHGLPLVS